MGGLDLLKLVLQAVSSKLSTVCAGNGIQAFLGADPLIPTTKVLLQSLTSSLPAVLLVMFLHD